jgi:hypothetical protein
MKNRMDLAGISDISDIGSVDMFGLDEFGNPVGLPPIYGALIGGGVATGTAIAVRAFSKEGDAAYKWSEGIGFAAGAAGAGVLMALKSVNAGWVALATAFLTNGLRQVELMLQPTAPAAEKLTTGMYGPVIERTQVLRGPGVNIQQLGIPSIERTGVVSGTDGSEPQLLGSTAPSARENTATLLGVPGLGTNVSGIAGNFGATLWGGN